MKRAADLSRWFVPPMKALAASRVPPGSWHLEMKFDGYRAIATLDAGRVELWSRNRRPLGDRFPDLQSALLRIREKHLVLDGEIVALTGSGLPSFQLLQRQAKAEVRAPVLFYAFDLLQRGDRSFIDQPIETRQRELHRVLRGGHKTLRISEVFNVSPEKLLAGVKRSGGEGIIAKRSGSRYEPDARSGAWLKCKVRREQEFVIGGFTAPKGGRDAFGALLVGYNATGSAPRALAYAGKVGTGFSNCELQALRATMMRLRQARCPFTQIPAERNATWIRPTLVCQVSFAEWTSDGLLRQAAFLGLRDDKAPSEVVREGNADASR